MREVAAIIELAEERDRKECIALDKKIAGANKELARWLIDHPSYPNTAVAKWLDCDESRIRRLRKWAINGFGSSHASDEARGVGRRPNEGLKTKDDFQDDGPAADQGDPDAPGVDAHTLKNILDSISQAKAVAEAWRKIVKASSFDSEEKARIYNAINLLTIKWKIVQSTLDRKGQGNGQS